MSARRTASDTPKTPAQRIEDARHEVAATRPRCAPSPEAERLAAREVEAAALDDARQRLAELHAAATAARDALAHACHAASYRRTADATGLHLATVTRWRYEVPVEPVLRAAQARRDPIASYAAEVDRAANRAGR